MRPARHSIQHAMQALTPRYMRESSDLALGVTVVRWDEVLPANEWRTEIITPRAYLLESGPLAVDAMLFDGIKYTGATPMYLMPHEAFEILGSRVHALSAGGLDTIELLGLITSRPADALMVWTSWISDALHRTEAHGLSLDELTNLAAIRAAYWTD